jgi:Fibronectin type-III domain/Subtilase family/Bacterial pre-peptidase C-terminal domain
VPTVHLQNTDRAAVKAYAATAGATAAINAASLVFNAPAPFTALFSSRGPLRGANGDLLKPDLIAPGQDILAAVSPVGYNGRLFDLLSGTSMSSPHVAGLAALLKELKPGWSPMAIKSALMTTGTDVLDGGTPPASENNPVLIFRQGAGHVRPNSAADPGLVFDSNFGDWLGFLCGTQLPTSFCTSAGVPVLDPSNLNMASIAIGDLAGLQTVTRRVTNVSGNPATFTASHTGLAGFNVVVTPAALTLAAGETKSFTVAFARTTAALNAYTGGQLRLANATHSVRVPVVLRPVALAAPPQVGGSYSVTFGYDGAFSATARGLIPAALTSGTVNQDPDQTFNAADPTGTVAVSVTIPAGTTYARFSLFDADVAAGSDIDLYVTNSAGTLVGVSGNGGSDEEVNLANPAAGTYTVYVHGWGLPSGSSAFKLHAWVLGTSAAGNMTVSAPASAVTGQSGAIGITTSGLTTGVKYLGSVAYGGGASATAPTIVRIDQ